MQKDMKEQALEELERALVPLSRSIANFPLGAISINDLKPIEERIQDMRESLKAMNSKILMLKAKNQAQTELGLLEENEPTLYDEMQEKLSRCHVNNLAVECCLQNTAAEEILEKPEDDEMSRTFKNVMHNLFSLNDSIMSLQQLRAKYSLFEMQLKFQLQKSLSEFKEFLKQQEIIRKKKLEETNPEIAGQKENVHKRLQKINTMKRLITNLSAVSADTVKDDSYLQELMKKHRELLSIDTIQEMAKEA